MNITEKTIQNKIYNYLSTHGITAGCRIVVGFSGGPDSTALLWLLSSVRQILGFDLIPVYVDHGIRSDVLMKDELRNVRANIEQLNLPLVVKRIPRGSIAGKSASLGRSIEEIARDFRYSILEEYKLTSAASHIATGHTLDDQLETIIMRFFQGSGIHGLSGIPEFRAGYIRPLLKIGKNELYDYLKEHNIPFVVDSTNFEGLYLRNKVRLDLIPMIARIFPGYKKSLTTLAKKSEHIKSVLESCSPALDIGVTDQGDPWFLAEDFFSLTPYQKEETLYKSWDKWTNRPFNSLPYKFISPLINQRGNYSANILLEGYSCRLIRNKELIIWKRVVVLSGKKSYLKVVLDGRQEIYPGLILQCEESNKISEDKVWIDSCMVVNPLIVRSKISGDRIHLAEGAKYLKKLYAEWGVSVDDRHKIPVIEDRSGIIAVLGMPFGFSNRIAGRYKNCSSNTKKIMISASYMENISE